MATYHVGCGLGDIYCGTLKKNGKEWMNRNECTKEAIGAVASYMWLNEKDYEVKFDGDTYRLQLVKIAEE